MSSTMESKINFFSRLNIKNKMTLGFGIIAGFLVIMAASTFWNLQKVTNLQKLSEASDHIRIYMLEARRNEKDFFLRKDLKYSELNSASVDSMQAMYEKVNKFKFSDSTKSRFDTLKNAIQSYDREFKNIVALWEKKGLNENTGLQGTFREATHLIESSIQERKLDNDVQAQLLQCRRNEKDYIMRQDSSYVVKLKDNAAKLKIILSKKGAGELSEQVDRYLSDFMAMTAVDKEIASSTEVLRREIHKLEPIQEKINNEIAKFYHSSVSTIQIILLVTTLIVIASSFFIAFILIQTITRPLKRVQNLATEIAAKDLRSTIEVDRTDEFGSLLESFKLMTESLRSTLSDIAHSAAIVASSTTELSSVSTQIAANAEEMNAQTSTVASATEQATANVNTISSAAEEMSSSVSSVAIAIEEMSSSLNEVSRNCQKELQIAAEATSYAKNSMEVMDKLGESAKSIGRVVEVINTIASQTNLLALNATIEAASAGDAGRGFAVVAHEVKALAKQTADATNEIAIQVQTMQSNSSLSIKSIESVSKVIEEFNMISQTIVSAVAQQSATVDEISKNVSGVSIGAQEVSRNVAESAKGLLEISTNINGVNSAVSDTAKGIGQVHTSTIELSKLSERLNELAGEFKL